MSFSFGFTNEDFSDDDIEESVNVNNVPVSKLNENPLDKLSETIDESSYPKMHTLESILHTLNGVRLTFDNYTTPIGQNIIYRRELFDVKHQIMCEDDDNSVKHGVTSDVLIGDNNVVDLKKNVYEGGFKSWECSYDMVDELSNMINNGKLKYKNLLEFGCGTALPTCFLLMKKFQMQDKTSTNYILSDFNYDVLRLVTVPNLIIHWASTLEPSKLNELCASQPTGDLEVDAPILSNDEVLITEPLINEFINQLSEYNVKLLFVSGSWGREFNSLLSGTPIDLIISSETIYSPESLPIVAESLIEILTQSNVPKSSCLIASKNFYFGVGGSVTEFVNYLKNKKLEKISLDVNEIHDSQLKRSLITLTYF